MANIQTTQRHLDIVQAYVREAIPRHTLHQQYGGFDYFVNVQLPITIDGLVCTLTELFAADPIQKWDIKYPTDWWEALKDRWAPTWFTNRYPVRYMEHHIDLKAIWQGYKPPTDKYGPFLPYVLSQVSED